jgi:hypothetical protein
MKAPMPSPEEVNAEFESFLAEMAFKPAAADQMRMFQPDKKWEILQSRTKPVWNFMQQ